MKKLFLPILLLFTFSLFIGCGDNMPQVTEEEAVTAISHSMTAMAMAQADDSALSVTVTDTPGRTTIAFNAHDISAYASPYTSLSGTIIIEGSRITYELTLSGGPAVTLYLVVDGGSAIRLEVNGHIMTGSVTLP